MIEQKMRTVPLPPQYTDEHIHERRQIMEALANLQREYQERAKPYTDRLASIEAHYATRVLLVPDDEL